jgi:hypothetical protein
MALCTKWNLDFLLFGSLRSFILWSRFDQSCHNFGTNSAVYSVHNTVVLHVPFFDCTVKLSIIWHVALILRTYVGSNGKKVSLVVIFCLLHCLHVMVVIRCVQWSNPVQLLMLLWSWNMVVRPTPVSVAQLGDPHTKHMAWKMFATRVERTWCGSLE